MAKKAFCRWCWQPLTMPDTYDRTTECAICTTGACMAAESLFMQHYSDKAILDREELEEIYNGGEE